MKMLFIFDFFLKKNSCSTHLRVSQPKWPPRQVVSVFCATLSLVFIKKGSPRIPSKDKVIHKERPPKSAKCFYHQFLSRKETHKLQARTRLFMRKQLQSQSTPPFQGVHHTQSLSPHFLFFFLHFFLSKNETTYKVKSCQRRLNG